LHSSPARFSSPSLNNSDRTQPHREPAGHSASFPQPGFSPSGLHSTFTSQRTPARCLWLGGNRNPRASQGSGVFLNKNRCL
jgi:hypothetical protein